MTHRKLKQKMEDRKSQEAIGGGVDQSDRQRHARDWSSNGSIANSTRIPIKTRTVRRQSRHSKVPPFSNISTGTKQLLDNLVLFVQKVQNSYWTR